MSAQFFGFNAPFLGGKENVFSRQVDDRLIKNDLLQLLLTSPGERVMRPNFGTNIRRFLFEQLTKNDISNLSRNIEEQIKKHESRVEVTKVVIDVDADNNLINVKIFGFFRFDKFANLVTPQEDADLLVELKLPTKKSNEVGTI